MTCAKHPKYKAVVRPRVPCKDCWVMYQETVAKAYKAALNDIQKSCKHANMVECDYIVRYSTWPPRRVCKDCGLAENGWHCGYQRLRTKHEYTDTLREFVPLVSRETVEKYTLTLSDAN
jgi:hypothetical protein